MRACFAFARTSLEFDDGGVSSSEFRLRGLDSGPADLVLRGVSQMITPTSHHTVGSPSSLFLSLFLSLTSMLHCHARGIVVITQYFSTIKNYYF